MSEEEKIEEYERHAIKAIQRPLILARILRENAEIKEGYANAHANSGSVWLTADGGYIFKKDVYANTAKMFRDAADIFDPPKPCK